MQQRTFGDGRGGTLIFLHDGLGAIEAWRDLPEALGGAAGAHVVLYDRWGYGRSATRSRFTAGFMEAEVPILGAVIDRFAVPPVHLVGHSDGASIALLYAARQSGRVSSVVSIAAHTFVEPATTRSIRALLEAADRGRLPGWLRRQHGERAGELLRAWGEVWLSAAHAEWDIRETIRSAECPVLALQGDQDEFGSLEQLRSIGARSPRAATWVVAGAGHSPHLDERDRFEERVVAFWGDA